MRRVVVLLAFLSGCAALVDPAHHGTAYMRAAWAEAEPCVVVCDRIYPNEMTRVIRRGDMCLCTTDRNAPMGASYYADDHAPDHSDEAVRFRIVEGK